MTGRNSVIAQANSLEEALEAMADMQEEEAHRRCAATRSALLKPSTTMM